MKLGLKRFGLLFSVLMALAMMLATYANAATPYGNVRINGQALGGFVIGVFRYHGTVLHHCSYGYCGWVTSESDGRLHFHRTANETVITDRSYVTYACQTDNGYVARSWHWSGRYPKPESRVTVVNGQTTGCDFVSFKLVIHKPT